MPYDARVLQILIASPGDVQSERAIISELIYEWNYTNSRERSVVLLPIRWETHSSPEMGSRPQAIINRQIVDQCDMAVAVFWMRLGTPTGEAESGTAEEIARIGNSGKTVMLYFSDAQVRPRSVDFTEYQRLQEFQRQTYPNGLIETYDTLDEFREKFRRQLASQISRIVTIDTKQQSGSSANGHNITLALAQMNPQALLSPSNVVELTRIICKDKDEIPDYTSTATDTLTTGGLVTVSNVPNRNFYREVVAYNERLALRRQLGLAMSSTSDQSMQDIHLDVTVQQISGRVLINPPALSWPSSLAQSFSSSTSFFGSPQQAEIHVQNISESECRIAADIPVVQAQRTVYLSGSFTITATEDSGLDFDATIYSSGGPPFALKTQLEIRIASQEMSYREILRQTVPGYDEANR